MLCKLLVCIRIEEINSIWNQSKRFITNHFFP
jgi:hypothetical protein